MSSGSFSDNSFDVDETWKDTISYTREFSVFTLCHCNDRELGQLRMIPLLSHEDLLRAETYSHYRDFRVRLRREYSSLKIDASFSTCLNSIKLMTLSRLISGIELSRTWFVIIKPSSTYFMLLLVKWPPEHCILIGGSCIMSQICARRFYDLCMMVTNMHRNIEYMYIHCRRNW